LLSGGRTIYSHSGCIGAIPSWPLTTTIDFQKLIVSTAYSLNDYLVVFVLVQNEGYNSILWQISQARVVQRLATLQHRQTQGEAIWLLLELEIHPLPTQIQVA